MQNTNGTSLKKEIGCTSCGKKTVKVKTDYQYTESGLDNVVLSRINVYKCSCGEIMPEIGNAEKLHWSIALELLKKPNLLTEREFCFLSKQMGHKRSITALLLGINPRLVYRWKRSDARIKMTGDRFIRRLYIMVMEGKYQRIVSEIQPFGFAIVPKKDLRRLENSDFKKTYEAAAPEIEFVKLQLRSLKFRSAKAWRHCYYFRWDRREWKSWQAQGVKNDSQTKKTY